MGYGQGQEKPKSNEDDSGLVLILRHDHKFEDKTSVVRTVAERKDVRVCH